MFFSIEFVVENIFRKTSEDILDLFMEKKTFLVIIVMQNLEEKTICNAILKQFTSGSSFNVTSANLEVQKKGLS